MKLVSKKPINCIECVQNICNIYKQNGDEEKKIWMKNYMRNQFEFFGIQKPQRLKIDKELMKNVLPSQPSLEEMDSLIRELWKVKIKDKLIDFIFSVVGIHNNNQKYFLIKELWKQKERECQMFAIDYCRKYINQMPASLLDSLYFCVTTKSWWDTVDYVSSQLIGPLVFNHSLNIEHWIYDDNMWARRACILYQLKYKNNTDWPLLQRIILETANEKEFFIQKSIGWILREYSKTNNQRVKTFLKDHQHKLSALSKNEAKKYLK